MKKLIITSALLISASISAIAAAHFTDSPITKIVACSQKGGAASAKEIMEIQAKEGLDVSRDTFLISQLAFCKDADDALISAAKGGNSYAIKALKMLKLADAEDALLELAKSGSKAKKDAMDALASCGSEKSLKFFLSDISTTAASNLGDYVKVSSELYKALAKDKKAEYKKSIQAQISSADGKVKAALERIITEQASAAEKKSKKKKA